VTALTIILSLWNLAYAGTLLLFDDFKGYDLGSDAFPMWIAHSGAWTVTGEGFQGTDCEGGYIALGASTGRKEWTDYTLSLKLKLISRASDWRDGPWIGFRYTDSGNAYTLGFYNRATVLHKASNGRTTGDRTAMAEAGTTIKDGKWHDLKIILIGAEITIVLDGNTIMQVTDNNWSGCPPVASGAIVLAARKWENSMGKTQVVFKDVRVEAIGEVPESMKFTIEDAERAACGIPRDDTKISMLHFLSERRSRRWTQVPRKVLAFYYPWYGRPENHGHWVHWDNVRPEAHEIANSTHYPAIGAYDSRDPATIDYHIHLAKSHGVDGFICSWWGQGTFEDGAFAKVLDRAEESSFEVTIYWETVPGEGRAKIARAVDDLLYILERYGSHPAFLKVDSKPVIFVYGRVMGQIDMSEWPEVITLTQECYGEDFLLIADGYQESYARLFDGIHTYNICGWVQGKTADELRDYSSKSFARAVEIAKSCARLSCITIIPGYDDTKIRTPGINAGRLGGEVYRVLWEQAIAADPDWILITSWNEWHEGSEIEPSWEYGDQYIKITGEYSRRFKETQYSSVKVPVPSPGISPEKAQELRELYKCQTIAILPDFRGEAVFWLADFGVDVKELTWQEVVDPAQLNVRNFPVLVYLSGEQYTQTLEKGGDVDVAILRYLREGGLLIAVSTEPFPFYYNEAGKAVVSARKFGFPIEVGGVYGWESPPPDVKLTFEIDDELLTSLPPSAPFPETGDLRWRPISGAELFNNDVYLPLAQLKDEKGNNYGDGIAYIEHKASPPRNGKNIYVWMRMPDVLNTGDLLYEIFRLAGERMTRAQHATPWDVNCDDTINILDLVFIASHFGEPGGAADLNGDGAVNILDLIIVSSYIVGKNLTQSNADQ
jgi:glycoprotein endo-alpha-1,2-mannosidase